MSASTGEGGEEIGDADAVEEDVEPGEAVDIRTSSCSEDCGDNELSGLSSGSSSVKIQLSSCSCITLSNICSTRSFSGDKSSSSSVSTRVLPDPVSKTLSESVTVTSPLLVVNSLTGLMLSKWSPSTTRFSVTLLDLLVGGEYLGGGGAGPFLDFSSFSVLTTSS